MTTRLRMSAAVSAAVGIPITITVYPPSAIVIGCGAMIAVAIVVWHLKIGGRAFVRRSPKGTLTFVLDSPRRHSVRGGRA